MHKVYLQIDLPAVSAGTGFAWADYIGHVLIDEVQIDIGGQQIDKHYGEWLTIWNDLTQTSEKEAGYNEMVGGPGTALTTPGTSQAATTLYVPLQFWFCRNAGLALPLIALQYHEVKFSITFRPLAQCFVGTGTVADTFNASLFVDYIYLDTDERRQFAQAQHEYLIEQLQFTGAESVSGNVKSKLALNHPCKELVWVIHKTANESGNLWADFTDSGADTFTDAFLQLNGQDRFQKRKAGYFNLVQPYQHHTRVPSVGVSVYSFSLNPEQHQPSGTVNMSRIDNATLQITDAVAGKLRVYAVNYNVLRVMAGMGGIAYSN